MNLSLPLALPSYQTGFVEVARVPFKFTQNGYTLTLAVPPKNLFHVIIRYSSSGFSLGVTMRFNGDSGANYAYTTSTAGAADSGSTGATSIALRNPSTTATTPNTWIDLWICNSPSAAIHRVLHGHEDQSVGSGTAPIRIEISACWASTVRIASISIIFGSSTGAYTMEGDVIVLGTD